jgi:transcription initiation factor IIE alpha subunit
VSTQENVTLDCPYCRNEIHRPLIWFKQAFFTCPACGGGLTAAQFATIVAELEQAFEETIEEMVRGPRGCGGCGCGKDPAES